MPVRRLGIVALLALPLAGCAGSSHGTAPAAGEAAATLRTAARAMRQSPGYRFAAHVVVGPGASDVTGEFQAPDRVHTLLSERGATVESVFLGNQAFVRDRSGRWVDRLQAPAAGTDPRASFDAVAAATGVTLVGDEYRFTLTGDAARRLAKASKVQGRARVVGGVVTRLEYDAGTLHVAIDYRDVGGPVTVDRPQLG